MKTVSDLNALIPQIIGHVLDNPEIGSCYYGKSEEDYEETYATNNICYDENGWCIEVSYRCCGEWRSDRGDYLTPPSSELLRAWGEVIDITAYHYDESADEETEFCDDQLNQLWDAINNALESI